MAFKTVLVELGRDTGCASRVGVAADLAKRSGGHVVGLTATGVPFERIPDAGSDAERYVDVARVGLAAQAEEMGVAFRRLMEQAAPGVAHTHRVVEEDPGWALAQEGRVSDIVVLAPPPDPYSVGSLAAETAEYVLLNAGRPVLLVPDAYQQAEMEHIVIAWDGWREAARAVADAMPLLLCAERVTIVAVWNRDDRPTPKSEPVAGLRQYLERHGIVAGVYNEPTSEAVGRVLLEATRSLNADLLVAGGYGHSRMREVMLGGTTRTLMHHAGMPLLLSH